MLKTVVSLITTSPGKSYKTHSGLFWACARIVESPYTGSEGLLWLGSGCSLLLIGLELEMNISWSQEMGMFWVRRAWSCESCLYAALKEIQSKSLSWVGSTYHLCLPGSAPESWRYKPEPGIESRHFDMEHEHLHCWAIQLPRSETVESEYPGLFFFPLMVMNTFTILQDCVSPFPNFFFGKFVTTSVFFLLNPFLWLPAFFRSL